MNALNVLLQAREVGCTITLEEGLVRTEFGSDVGALKNHLMRALKDRQPTLTVQGDSRIKWNMVVDVMDACRQAGFVRIGFAAPPDLGLDRQ